jgi:hypothetical protein
LPKQSKESDEIEIDLDVLDDTTLRELEAYVKKVTRRAASRKRKPAAARKPAQTPAKRSANSKAVESAAINAAEDEEVVIDDETAPAAPAAPAPAPAPATTLTTQVQLSTRPVQPQATGSAQPTTQAALTTTPPSTTLSQPVIRMDTPAHSNLSSIGHPPDSSIIRGLTAAQDEESCTSSSSSDQDSDSDDTSSDSGMASDRLPQRNELLIELLKTVVGEPDSSSYDSS